uniref:Uncharacterized protein n=1 Tax=Setaria italica TaxID=4555 RepID=K4AGR7_SETIT
MPTAGNKRPAYKPLEQEHEEHEEHPDLPITRTSRARTGARKDERRAARPVELAALDPWIGAAAGQPASLAFAAVLASFCFGLSTLILNRVNQEHWVLIKRTACTCGSSSALRLYAWTTKI